MRITILAVAGAALALAACAGEPAAPPTATAPPPVVTPPPAPEAGPAPPAKPTTPIGSSQLPPTVPRNSGAP